MLTEKVKEWLSSWKVLSPQQQSEFGRRLENDEELIADLFAILSYSRDDERESVCSQLYEFYRSDNGKIRLFSLQFVPAMVAASLLETASATAGIQSAILGMYNLSVMAADGTPVVREFRLPMLFKPSIYHSPGSLGLQKAQGLTEVALLQHTERESRFILGPLPQVEALNATSRMLVISCVLGTYNDSIGSFSRRSHQELCEMSLRLANSGYTHQNAPRVPLESSFLLECLRGLYFVLFNGQTHAALEALRAVQRRAALDLFPDVLLMANAIEHSVQHSNLGGPFGQTVSMAHYSSQRRLSRQALTNASFRATRLPEDIPIRDGQARIEEENDDTSQTVNGSKPHSSDSAPNLSGEMQLRGDDVSDNGRHLLAEQIRVAKSASMSWTPSKRSENSLWSSAVDDLPATAPASSIYAGEMVEVESQL